MSKIPLQAQDMEFEGKIEAKLTVTIFEQLPRPQIRPKSKIQNLMRPSDSQWQDNHLSTENV